jgi:hypothetical protein
MVHEVLFERPRSLAEQRVYCVVGHFALFCWQIIPSAQPSDWMEEEGFVHCCGTSLCCCIQLSASFPPRTPAVHHRPRSRDTTGVEICGEGPRAGATLGTHSKFPSRSSQLTPSWRRSGGGFRAPTATSRKEPVDSSFLHHRSRRDLPHRARS